jgi:diguanylate cyclase (GGDEF)-like protein
MTLLGPEMLTRLLAIQTEIAADLDFSRVMQLVARRSHELTGGNGATIELVEGDEMVYRAGAGTALPHIGLRLPRSESLSGLCVAQGQPLVCADSEEDPRVNREACRRVGLRSMIVVPLRRGDETAGVLKVMSAEVGAFGEAHLQLLQLLAGFIAFAMHNATTFERAQRMSLHDALTGLPNRLLFRDRLSNQLAQLERAPGYIGLLYVDLDGFKPVNDTHGHAAGDQVLLGAARRLVAAVRDTDTVARLGGDEFAVLLTQLKTEGAVARAAERVRESIEGTPFVLASGTVAIGASIGVALTSDPRRHVDALIAEADAAMYTVKTSRNATPPGPGPVQRA